VTWDGSKGGIFGKQEGEEEDEIESFFLFLENKRKG
jgi:hypothetical protein